MLSILIPVYNYAVLPLVSKLQKQCISCGIKFEILCFDDASNIFIKENQEINQFSGCSIVSLEKNIGRSAIRNLLARKATFENLLFLDADTIPVHDDFISNYVSEIKNNQKVVFGGLLYENKKPAKEVLLRWIYGRNREALSLSERNKKPSDFALVSNLLIKKEIVNRFPFDETITQYGYEDLVFFSVLKENQIGIKHIENAVFHLNLETSTVFLSKTKTALENLAFLNDTNKVSVNESKIIASFELLKTSKLLGIFRFIFRKIESKIERNLVSETPSLFLFDIYKLGYYSFLKRK
ncbi:glycosyltransferase involved in cell wall biosynthesis [Flavobacterium nitrogenifigens]|uniref:Glycosyltransferase involved in cell wall biosynthesis n=2 Tax=Flavobacterium TaxID=237 RepID=A0A7W7IYN5_9FLAO|nr:MULTISPECIES: glycosyltransferase family 2 protein [Flavobacterium]MBB4803019.1 glycosyltransferase involved in cell wall biosynthesis [Flavobacterium nitrogenifigens]MBB6387977.1 glycosyltransferase involved in cell wall biosynthesis [Flavobacterium notoginsengisoli]